MKRLPTTLRSFRDNILLEGCYNIRSKFHSDSNSIDIDLYVSFIGNFKICTITSSGYYFYLNNIINYYPDFLSGEVLDYLYSLFNKGPNLFGIFILSNTHKIYYFNKMFNDSNQFLNLNLPFFVDNDSNIHSFTPTFHREQKEWLQLLLFSKLNEYNFYIRDKSYYAIVRVNVKGELILSSFISFYMSSDKIDKEAGVTEFYQGYHRSKKILNRYCTGLSSKENKIRFLIKLDLEKFDYLIGESKLTLLSELAKYE